MTFLSGRYLLLTNSKLNETILFSYIGELPTEKLASYKSYNLFVNSFLVGYFAVEFANRRESSERWVAESCAFFPEIIL